MVLMKKAGCRLIIPGFESGDQEILNNIHKGIKVEQSKLFMKNAKKAGLNQNSLIDLKKGRKKSLKFDDVVKIADVLDVSLDEFRKDNT